MLLADGLVERLEAGVLRREAALGGRVDDQDDLALVLGQVDGLAALCGVLGPNPETAKELHKGIRTVEGLKVVERRGGSHCDV